MGKSALGGEQVVGVKGDNFEIHVNIDPPATEGARSVLRDICGFSRWKTTEMDNDQEHNEKLILTTHDSELTRAMDRMTEIITILKKHNFTVRRYKVEKVIVDSKLQGDLRRLL